jgi:microcystin-dependent protein
MSVNKVNKTTGDLSLLAGGTLYADSPIGSIIPYGGSTAPAGWFICDGTELVRTTYPELFAVIGTSFGTPSDNTKFKLPDLRGKFVEGVPISGSVGANISAGLPNITGELGYLKALSSYNYVEGINVQSGAFSSSFNLKLDPVQYAAATSEDVTTNSGMVVFQASDSNSIYGRSDTVQPPSVCVNYIIKAVSVGIPADFMSAVDEAVARINTSGITESSALSNIGTSANATQHEVNVAIDSAIEEMQQYDDTDYVEIAQGLTPVSQVDVDRVSILAKRKGNVVTLHVYFEINLTGSTHLTLRLLPAGSILTKYRPTINSPITVLGYRNSETTYTIGRFILDTDGSVSLGEYYTSGNDQATTVFNFEMTYVV